MAGGVAVTVTEETEYPFRDTIRMTLTPARDVAFPLLLRVPAWAAGAELTVNGYRAGWRSPGKLPPRRADLEAGGSCPAAPADAGARITLVQRVGTSLERGPLVFSLRIGEDWRSSRAA